MKKKQIYLLIFLWFLIRISYASAHGIQSLIPLPQIITSKGHVLSLNDDWQIVVDMANPRYAFCAQFMQEKLNSQYGLNIPLTDINNGLPAQKYIILGNPFEQQLVADLIKNKGMSLSRSFHPQGYILETFNEPVEQIIIIANSPQGVFYGVQTLLQLVNSQNTVEGAKVKDWPNHELRGMHIARRNSPLYLEGYLENVPSFTEKQKQEIDKLAGLKINFVIYTDRRGDFFKGPEYLTAYKELADYCKERFIEFIPSVGSLRSNYYFPFALFEGWWIKDERFTFGADNSALPDKPFIDLLSNGDFEIDVDQNNKPDGWSISSQEIYLDSDAYSGKYSLKMNSGYSYLYLPVEPNSHYYLSAYAKGDMPDIYLQAYNTKGAVVYSSSDYVQTSLTSWRKFGVVLKTGEDIIKIRIGLSRFRGSVSPVWVDAVKFYRVDGALRNIIRTDTTDIEVMNLDKTVCYLKDVDYEIINGKTDLVFDEGLEPFKILRKEGGSIALGQQVLVSYDSYLYWSRSSNYNQPPCVSDQRLYTQYYYPAIDKVIENFHPKFIFFNSDEIRGFNRDSRNVKRDLSNAQLLAEWINKINNYLRSKNSGCRMMMWDDMVSPYHNGGQENYQLMYGGKPGRTAEVTEQSMIDNDVIMGVWWYSDDYLEKMYGATQFFSSKGFDYLGTPWYDHKNIQSWAQLIANKNHSLGGIISEWGSPEPEAHYPFGADYFWNSRYEVVYFDDFNNDKDNNAIPDGWNYTGEINPAIANLIPNPSFENDLQDWTLRYQDSGTPRIDVVCSYDGSKSAYFQNNNSSNGSVIQGSWIPVEPDTQYVLSAWGKGNNVSVGKGASWYKLYLIARFYDAINGNQLSSPFPDLDFYTGTFDWTYFERIYRSPATAKYFRITSLGIIGDGRGEGWVDSLKLYKYVSSPYVKGSVSVKGNTNVWYSNLSAVKNGREYIISLYVKREGTGNAEPSLKVVWYDQAGKEISQENRLISEVTSVYKCCDFNFISPEQASTMRIYLEGRENTEEYFWFDTVIIKEKMNPYSAITGNFDLNADGAVDVLDVQMCVNVIFGLEQNGTFTNKAKQVSWPLDECTVSDLQAVVNAVLGGGG